MKKFIYCRSKKITEKESIYARIKEVHLPKVVGLCRNIFFEANLLTFLFIFKGGE